MRIWVEIQEACHIFGVAFRPGDCLLTHVLNWRDYVETRNHD